MILVIIWLVVYLAGALATYLILNENRNFAGDTEDSLFLHCLLWPMFWLFFLLFYR